MSIIDDAGAIAQRLKEIQGERSREIAGKPDTASPALPSTVTGSGGIITPNAIPHDYIG